MGIPIFCDVSCVANEAKFNILVLFLLSDRKGLCQTSPEYHQYSLDMLETVWLSDDHNHVCSYSMFSGDNFILQVRYDDLYPMCSLMLWSCVSRCAILFVAILLVRICFTIEVGL